MTKKQSNETALLPFWERLLLTVGCMMVVSFLAGWFWHNLFGFTMPAYASGIIGGLTALPIWELLKRIKPKNE